MPCQLRKPDETDPMPPNPAKTRMGKLQDLVCGGPWNGRDDICLIYWKPDVSKWVAWVDQPPPMFDPLPQAEVSVAP